MAEARTKELCDEYVTKIVDVVRTEMGAILQHVPRTVNYFLPPRHHVYNHIMLIALVLFALCLLFFTCRKGGIVCIFYNYSARTKRPKNGLVDEDGGSSGAVIIKDANNPAFPASEKQRLNKLDFTACAKAADSFRSQP
jgi:hypothetical protein